MLAGQVEDQGLDLYVNSNFYFLLASDLITSVDALVTRTEPAHSSTCSFSC